MNKSKGPPDLPRANPPPRQEQLRLAKRRQRQREREQGLQIVQLRLRAPYGAMLRRMASDAEFVGNLEALLAQAARRRREPSRLPNAIRLAEYPQLRLLAWSREPAMRTVAPEEALGLYERNWRFIDPASLEQREAALIRRLAEQFGAGVLNVRGQGLS